MNTKERIDAQQSQLDSLARAVMAMNDRIKQLEHFKKPFVSRVVANVSAVLSKRRP